MTIRIFRANFKVEEFKHVRYTTVYTTPLHHLGTRNGSGPELVIHFDWEECRPQENIPLAEILEITAEK